MCQRHSNFHLPPTRWLLFGASWGSTLILAYGERHPDPKVREKAAKDWAAWGDAVISPEPNGKPDA